VDWLAGVGAKVVKGFVKFCLPAGAGQRCVGARWCRSDFAGWVKREKAVVGSGRAGELDSCYV